MITIVKELIENIHITEKEISKMDTEICRIEKEIFEEFIELSKRELEFERIYKRVNGLDVGEEVEEYFLIRGCLVSSRRIYTYREETSRKYQIGVQELFVLEDGTLKAFNSITENDSYSKSLPCQAGKIMSSRK